MKSQPGPLLMSLSLDSIFLDLSNPRHMEFQSSAEVIEYLLAKEKILPLIKDIAENGTNPLDLIAVTQVQGRRDVYVVAEGNRRIAALKLMRDPRLAPSPYNNQIEKLVRRIKAPSKVQCVVFANSTLARPWVTRMHSGEQGGIGRRNWSAEQKTRHDLQDPLTKNKNALAQRLLDYAQANKLITSTERMRRLTTVQRFISNKKFREALGIEAEGSSFLMLRPPPAFQKVLKAFIQDLLQGKVGSRDNRAEIEKYAAKLERQFGPTPKKPEEVKPNRVSSAGRFAIERRSNAGNTRPSRGSRSVQMNFNEIVDKSFKKMSGQKLFTLYRSVCGLELNANCALATVGVWSLFESLTALLGRNSSQQFPDFIAANFKRFGFADKYDTRAIKAALSRISNEGNTTKHHPIAAAMNGAQLANDMATLNVLLQRLAVEAAEQ